MPEAVRLAASIGAIINLSFKVATLCFQYSAAVANAKDEIKSLERQVINLRTCLERAQHLLDGPNQHAFETSQALVDSLEDCTSELARVQNRLDPGKARKAMRRVGLRALKWPLSSKELSKILSNLERYKQTIMLCLQVDQTSILLDIQQRFEGVSIQPCRDTETTCKPCFNVPFDRDPDFVDRPHIMTWLKEQYTGSAGRMALVGMGGFGKSQVAIQFAHHIHDTSPQTSVFWVHASSRPRFEEAYRSIADRLRLPRRNDPGVDVLRLVCDWLQTEEAGSWLMILDNADDVNLFYSSHDIRENNASSQPTGKNVVDKAEQRPLAAYLPKQRSRPILVTSRSIDAAEKLTGSQKSIYRISTMDNVQGLQLFQNKLIEDFDREPASALLQALDFIPLAITQAAAYINHRAHASVETYLDTFRESDKKKSSLLNSDRGDLRRDETVSNSVITTWQVTFEQIRHERPSAANLLSFMCFFNPQGIPESVLRSYNTDLTGNIGRDTDSGYFENDLDLLCSYSLVSMTATRGICEMHPLVQFCTRAWIYVAHEKEKWQKMFLLTMSRNFPSGYFETWSTCQMLFPHVESLLEDTPSDEDLQKWASLLSNCANYLLQIGNLRAAERFGKKATETRYNILGKENLDTLRSMGDLALIYKDQNRMKEAEELSLQAVEISRRVFGEEHPEAFVNMAILGITYRDQERWKEAEEIFAQVMEIAKRLYGEEHLSTLTSIDNLASVYRDQGRWKEAEELQVQVVEMTKKLIGEEHPDTIRSMANLAITYTKQNRWKEAEEIQARLMEINSTVLGGKHLYTLRNMLHLARTYRKQGRWEEAEKLVVQVVETRRKILGEEDPRTLTSMFNLAGIWKGLGRTADALGLLRHCVALQERVFGAEDHLTLSWSSMLTEWEKEEELSGQD